MKIKLFIYFLKLFYNIIVFYYFPISTSSLSYIINEENERNFPIGNLIKDLNLDPLAHPQFSIINSGSNREANKYFYVDYDGILKTTQNKIDREEICFLQLNCIFPFSLAISDQIEGFRTFNIEILIKDINDHNPEFDLDQENIFEISEGVEPGFSIPLPLANDKDGGELIVKKYEINNFEIIKNDKYKNSDLNNDYNDYFSLIYQNIPTPSLSLKLEKALDREKVEKIKMIITANDEDPINPKSADFPIEIKVLDVNDNFPKFENNGFYNLFLDVDTKPGKDMIQVKAEDEDQGKNGIIQYKINSFDKIQAYFRINKTTGWISLEKSLPLDTPENFEIFISAQDSGQFPKISNATVEVLVTKKREELPMLIFSNLIGSQRAGILEGQAPGKNIFYFVVQSKEKVICNINDTENFNIKPFGEKNYRVLTVKELKFEKDQINYFIKIKCELEKKNYLFVEEIIKVELMDIDDNPPFFIEKNYQTELMENIPGWTSVFQIKAEDNDTKLNSSFKYSLCPQSIHLKNLINLDEISGEIKMATMDREKIKKLEFCVEADNFCSHCSMEQRNFDKTNTTTNTKIIINILDENDNKPIFLKKKYDFFIEENSPPDLFVGLVEAYDLDSSPFNETEYEIISQDDTPLPFRMDSDSGNIYTLNGEIDREKQDYYHFKVKAKDKNNKNLFSTTKVFIKISDLNDNKPTINTNCNNKSFNFINKNKERFVKICDLKITDLDLNKNLNISVSKSYSTQLFFVNSSSNSFQMDKNQLLKIPEVIFSNYIVPFNNTILVKDGDFEVEKKINFNVDFGKNFSFAQLGASRNKKCFFKENMIYFITAGILAILLFISLIFICCFVRKKRKIRRIEKRDPYKSSSLRKNKKPSYDGDLSNEFDYLKPKNYNNNHNKKSRFSSLSKQLSQNKSNHSPIVKQNSNNNINNREMDKMSKEKSSSINSLKKKKNDDKQFEKNGNSVSNLNYSVNSLRKPYFNPNPKDSDIPSTQKLLTQNQDYVNVESQNAPRHSSQITVGDDGQNYNFKTFLESPTNQNTFKRNQLV